MKRAFVQTLVFSGWMMVVLPCFALAADQPAESKAPAAEKPAKSSGKTEAQKTAAVAAKPPESLRRPAGIASDFLISHYAQSRYDWGTANIYISRVLARDADNPELLKRAMIMAMGAGDLRNAVDHANRLHDIMPKNTLAELVRSVGALADGRNDDAVAAIDAMPAGEITDFVGPLLRGWAMAGEGKLDTDKIGGSPIHSYNGALIALYMKDKERALGLLRGLTDAGGVNPFDAERAGDLMVAAGMKDEALKLYQSILDHDAGGKSLQKKVTTLKADGDMSRLVPALRIKTTRQGAAITMFDMARLLFDERSDSSVKLFANMALALDPDMQEARLLLANVLARNGRYDEALEILSRVVPGDEFYVEVQHYMADLMVQDGRNAEAMETLRNLFTRYNDIDALIRIGDIRRGQEDFEGALQAYNDAASKIGGTIPEKYWYLLYARGMAYEREGKWPRAESDFKAALAYRPDHPYLMNYLAYGWADQGVNLDESLALLEKASSLRPADGYISDSLGWVLYRMGRYDEALPELEKAVALLPYDATLNDHLGDLYWKRGRRLEARFQWERAMNVAEDEEMKVKLREKLASGLSGAAMREAKTDVKTGASAP